MRTITLVGYKRPAYTEHCLRYVNSCRDLEKFDRLKVFIEPGCAAVVDVCQAWAGRMQIQTEVHVNEERLGVDWNNFRAYSTVFDELGSDFNVAIEDDTQLSPDALELALWFLKNHGGAESRYQFLNLCDHYQYRGAGLNRNGLPEDPLLLAETNSLSSPFAWCLPKRAWPFIKKHWNRNRGSLQGWDWSIRFAMRIEQAVALTPVVSRCRNVGRLDGTNENAETFRVQLGLNYSDGSHRGEYKIVNPLSEKERRTLDTWMISELPRYCTGRR